MKFIDVVAAAPGEDICRTYLLNVDKIFAIYDDDEGARIVVELSPGVVAELITSDTPKCLLKAINFGEDE